MYCHTFEFTYKELVVNTGKDRAKNTVKETDK